MAEILHVTGLYKRFGGNEVLSGIDLSVGAGEVVCVIGPSGSGKSTFLRCINPGRVAGEIILDGENINDPRLDVVTLRRRVGMVFQKPNPFPKTIFENVAYGLRVNGVKDRDFIANRVEGSLHQAALWDEVSDRLHRSALSLSGGQQQRLCIARALAVEPEVLLPTTPSSSSPTTCSRLPESPIIPPSSIWESSSKSM